MLRFLLRKMLKIESKVAQLKENNRDRLATYSVHYLKDNKPVRSFDALFLEKDEDLEIAYRGRGFFLISEVVSIETLDLKQFRSFSCNQLLMLWSVYFSLVTSSFSTNAFDPPDAQFPIVEKMITDAETRFIDPPYTRPQIKGWQRVENNFEFQTITIPIFE